ncbi:TraX family protein [Ramlibacter tataouinensis]|uniref:TraX family protein n=1 Tax=Ramlibacter tataouinensis TaxID=94132 RepID=UPI0022F3C770|nr:TraX family protein [Ramlibacter tataouinensis]WBY00454.1 TraX family protein [Ramlibacter tataouinensis]
MATALRPQAPLGFADGQLEALKWVGMAAMFCDHIGRHLLGMPHESWAFIAGRLAFPLFALVLGLNLAREGDRAARCVRVTWRLLAWGAVSVLPSIWARGDPALLNVLFTLGLGAALCWMLESPAHAAWRALACLAIATASWFVEFGTGGVFLVAATYLYAIRRGGGLATVVIVLLLATAWLNAIFGGWPAFFGTLAALPVAWLAQRLPLRVPRWQWLFYLTYPVHLAVIGALKAAG